MDKRVEDLSKLWQQEPFDTEIIAEIKALADSDNERELTERFYKDLDFGTGGLRGIMGAGTNRMNVYTVRKATQGLSNYMIKVFGDEAKTLVAVVAYDARRKSDLFAKEVALNFAANGIKVYLFDKMCPTPELSFAVRHFNAISGVNVTASHNPPEYNGYKAYWCDGAQVTPPNDDGIISEVNKIESFDDCKTMTIEAALKSGILTMVGKDIDEIYFDRIDTLALSSDLVKKYNDKVKIVYTPLHGAGYYCVPEMLKRFGFKNVLVVPEQAEPDGDFPTIKAPNPEVLDSMALAIKLAEKEDANIILGTDADSDRIGMGVPVGDGTFKLLTGNQIGVVLIDYYLKKLKDGGKIPPDGVVIKTIVTTELQRKVASSYGVECLDVLTGFKWIGRKMLDFEEKRAKGEDSHTYLVGGEESYGFLAGDFVRDKDAVIAACLLSEAAVECQSQGITLLDRLDQIYLENGYFLDELKNVFHEGKEGAEKIVQIMAHLRTSSPKEFGGFKVVERWDVKSNEKFNASGVNTGKTGLPSSNVLVWFLENGCKITARPSGTEPKIKFYFSICAEKDSADTTLADLKIKAKGLSGNIVGNFMGMVGQI